MSDKYICSKKRDISIDIAKGIAILLVIVGHSQGPAILNSFIYSFHMPLFFIVSGYFYRSKGVSESLKNDLKRLVVPYLFASLCICVWMLVLSFKWSDNSYIKNEMIAAFWGSGMIHTSPLWGSIPFVGAIWFLLALFWSKNIFNVLRYLIQNDVILSLFGVGISVVAVILDRYVINLPFAFLPGLSGIVFIILGYYAQKTRIRYWMILIIISCWIFCIFGSKIDMVNCTYNFYLIDVLGAAGGTFFIVFVSKQLSKTFCRNLFAFIGMNSLPILIVHFLEMHGWILSYLNIPMNNWYEVVIARFLFVFIVLFALSNVKFIVQSIGIIKFTKSGLENRQWGG